MTAFLSPGIGYRAAVFPVCKICAFNQSNAFVLIAKYIIFFYYFSKIYFILFYIQLSKQVHLIDWMYIFYILKKLQLYYQYLVIKMQPNAKKYIKYSNVYTVGHNIVIVIGHMIFINIWKAGIMKQIVTIGIFTVLMLSNLFWR